MSDAVARLNTALEGRYRVERQIGEGGMATVYLAHDLRHGRQVALKVLKPELAAVVGAERFLAEIRTTAQLQHPHILPLFDSGEAGSFLFYVMPFVAGETLRERLDREKQLPVHEAIQIASSVAHALQHAHDRGVIHRDIKPANILMQDGQPVVSDFGIALAVGSGGGARLTETGLSVGTPYYMSPEQATGDQQIGPPSDIYSLGAVLYEMLTGEPPYTGSTAQAVLGRIIQGAPVSATEVRKSVPANVDEAINMALEKLPADRFSGAQDFARALGDPSFRHGGQSGARVDEVASTAWRRRWVAAVAFAGVSTLAAAWGWLRPIPLPAPATYDVGVSDTVPMQLNKDTRAFTVSPTGDFLVYVARRDSTTELWYRSLTSAEARPIPGTRGAWGTPMLSSDGGRVLFALGTQMRLGPVAGGAAPTTVADILNIPYSDLGSTDRTRYVDGSVLRTVDLVSGELVEDLPIDCMLPWTLADGRRALCGGGGVKFGTVVDLGSGETRPLRVAPNESLRLRGSDFRVVDDEYLLFMSLEGDLKAASFDQLGDVVGRSITVLPGVRTENYSGRGQYQVTSDGTLYYLPGLHHQVSRLVRAGPTGEVTALPVKPAAFLRMALSPDGRSLAAVVEGVRSQELRIYDLQTGLFSVWLEGEGILQPVWSPAGDLVLVQSFRADGQGDVLLGSPASTSPADVVATVPGFFWPIAYRADSVIVGSSGSALYALDARTVPATIDSLGEGTIFDRMSPDGRWLASPDQDGGSNQGIRLEPWPSRDRVYRLPGAGDFGAWVSSGEFVSGPDYASGVRFFRTPFNTASQSPLGEPALWFADLQFTQGASAPFVTTLAGGIIYLQALEGGVEHFIRVIPGWVDQMKRMVDEANRG